MTQSQEEFKKLINWLTITYLTNFNLKDDQKDFERFITFLVVTKTLKSNGKSCSVDEYKKIIGL